MINDIPIKDKNNLEKKKRIIMFTVIGIICVIAIIVTVVMQINELETPTPVVDNSSETEIVEFSTLFDNTLNNQGYSTEQIEKIKDNEQIVYTSYEQNNKVEGQYEIELAIPAINIDNTVTNAINQEIEEIFKNKASSVINNDLDYEVIYTVEYTAYINSNILSLVIKSTLKEGSNAQRVIVKTYTYNLDTNETVDINEMLSIKNLNKSDLEKTIIEVVTENAEQNESLISLGYNVYQRDLTDEMYEVDNVTNFFYGPDGVLYIIYAYGNNSYTSELDVIYVI